MTPPVRETPPYVGPDRRIDDRRVEERKVGGRRVDDARRDEDHHHHIDIRQQIEQGLGGCPLVDAETHHMHHEYLRIVLQREAAKATLRKAIIEKTFVGLVWAAIAFVGQRAATFAAEHWKP